MLWIGSKRKFFFSFAEEFLAPTWFLSAVDSDRGNSGHGPESQWLPAPVPSAPAFPLEPDGPCRWTTLSRSERRWTCLQTCINPARKMAGSWYRSLYEKHAHNGAQEQRRGRGQQQRATQGPPAPSKVLIALLAQVPTSYQLFPCDSPRPVMLFPVLNNYIFLRERTHRLA